MESPVWRTFQQPENYENHIYHDILNINAILLHTPYT